MKKRSDYKLIFLFLVIGIFLVSFVIAQEPQESPVDVTVQVGSGSAPDVFEVSPIADVALSAGPASTTIAGTIAPADQPSVTEPTFLFKVSDADSNVNIDDTTAQVTLSKAGEISRVSSSCVRNGALSSGNTAVYECAIDMEWHDGPGVWDIDVVISDLNGNSQTQSYRDGVVDKFNVLASIGISVTPGSLAFPVLSPGGTDQMATNDPIVLSNTGNVDPLDLEFLATHLVGQTTPSEQIDSDDFAVGLTTGQECNVGDANTNQMAVGGATYVSMVSLPAFSLSHGDYVSTPTLQEEFYVCLMTVDPTLSAQIYSATGASAWDILVS
jgi:hypothetical protein